MRGGRLRLINIGSRIYAGVENQPLTGSPANAVLHRDGGIAEPIAVARVLKGCGLSLRKAHELLNRIAAGDEVVVILPAVTSRKGWQISSVKLVSPSTGARRPMWSTFALCARR
jgi:hypothetical protein